MGNGPLRGDCKQITFKFTAEMQHEKVLKILHKSLPRATNLKTVNNSRNNYFGENEATIETVGEEYWYATVQCL